MRPATWLTLLTCFLMFSSIVGRADVTCSPSTPITHQSRTGMKHRSPGLMNVAAKQVSVANMLSWPNPSTISRTSNSPIDPRENQSYTLQGELWRVKTEGNDCDFHLELSPPGDSSSADRVITHPGSQG